MTHPSCPKCAAPLHYSIAIFGRRKPNPPCSEWMCSRNFFPPTESVIKSMRGFLNWWSKLTPATGGPKDTTKAEKA